MAMTRDARLAQNRKRALMRSGGTRAFVPAGPVTDHIRALYEHPEGGMSCQQIADAAGVSVETISSARRGLKTTMLDRTATRILCIRYEGVETPFGARTDPTGTHRRIQALYSLGFTCVAMAGEMGNANPRVIWNYLHNKASVTAVVATRAKAMYEKLRYVDPNDFGIFPPVITRNRKMASSRGWAPPHCWDDDTMDDPEVFAEWTGACGSMKGVRIHRKERIPVCGPCRGAEAEKLRLFNEKRGR